MAKYKWDEAMVAEMVAFYTERREAGDTNKAIIDAIIRKYDDPKLTAPRIRGKLMAEKVYVKNDENEVAAEDNGKAKDVLVRELLDRMGLTGDKLAEEYLAKRLAKAWVEYLIREIDKRNG